jgi:hypothetical protein
MNSCDRKFRDERDLRELLRFADNVTAMLTDQHPSAGATMMREWFERLRDRRTAEDDGQVVG